MKTNKDFFVLLRAGVCVVVGVDVDSNINWHEVTDFAVKQNDFALCKVDRSHHHHTVFHWNGISVENHYDFVNVYSHPCHKKIDQMLKKLAEKEESVTSKDGVLLPSPNWAALFTFIAQLRILQLRA